MQKKQTCASNLKLKKLFDNWTIHGERTFDDVCHLGKINQKAKKMYSNETSNYIQYITQSWKVSAHVRNVWTGASHHWRGKECQKCEEHKCLVMPESDMKNDELRELLQNQSHRVLRIQKNAQDRRPSATKQPAWKVPLFTAHQAPGLVSTHWGPAQGCHCVRRRKFFGNVARCIWFQDLYRLKLNVPSVATAEMDSWLTSVCIGLSFHYFHIVSLVPDGCSSNESLGIQGAIA